MDALNSQTIPAWLVAVSMITTGLMWALCIKRKIRVDIRIFVMTFIVEGLVYATAFQFFDLGVEFRGFMSRLIMMVLCWSQFIPLAVAYYRSL